MKITDRTNEKKEQNQFFKVGSILKIDGSFYIVAQIEAHEYNLICLESGNRFQDSIKRAGYKEETFGFFKSEIDTRGTFELVNAELIVTSI